MKDTVATLFPRNPVPAAAGARNRTARRARRDAAGIRVRTWRLRQRRARYR